MPDEVPHDQQVAREAHLLDQRDLRFEAFFILRQTVLQSAPRGLLLQPRAPPLEALPRHPGEVRVDGVFRRHVEFRKRLRDLFQLHLAALGDLPGPVERVFDLAEQHHHLLAVLDEQLLRREAQPFLVVHRLAGLDAGQDVLRARVGLLQVMRVVGRHQRNAGLGREPVHLRHRHAVLAQAVVLNFEEEVPLAEQVLVFVGMAPRLVVALPENRLRDLALQARR